jgi:hypothetical protein
MGGWIKLHRQLIANGWLKNKNVCVFWLYCLLKATHEPVKAIVGFQEVHLEPGQFIFGRHKAAKETGLSEQEIRTCLAFLSKAQNLTIKSTNKFSIITVNNWHTYQDADKANQPASQPASNQQVTTYKNEKNKRIYVADSIESQLSVLLLEEIRKNKPDFKEPNLQVWAKEVDLMTRRDGRNSEKIRQVIQWAQKDSFWHKNILSTGKLRKQFDQLEMAMGKVSSW